MDQKLFAARKNFREASEIPAQPTVQDLAAALREMAKGLVLVTEVLDRIKEEVKKAQN